MRQEIQCTPAAAVRVFAAQLLSEPAAAGARTGHWSYDAKRAFKQHWPEYLIEGFCLGMFMISACTFAALREHPASPVRMSVANADFRRSLGGLAMGLTAVLLIYSPFGRRSGAHMNPATTLTFYRLGKVAPWDAAFYVLSQFLGGVLGTLVGLVALGRKLATKFTLLCMPAPRIPGRVIVRVHRRSVVMVM